MGIEREFSSEERSRVGGPHTEILDHLNENSLENELCFTARKLQIFFKNGESKKFKNREFSSVFRGESLRCGGEDIPLQEVAKIRILGGTVTVFERENGPGINVLQVIEYDFSGSKITKTYDNLKIDDEEYRKELEEGIAEYERELERLKGKKEE